MRQAVLWVVALSAACAASRAPLSLAPSGELNASDYNSVLEKWSRSDDIYDLLASKLFVDATFHSPEFRKAFLLRHPDVYGPGSEVARRLALTDPDGDEAIEFFFSAATNDHRWNDFDEDDSIWRVTLTGDGGEPVDGKVIRIRTTANIRVIYPYISDFARTYAVRFPRTDRNGRPVISSASTGFDLKFVSALGEAQLRWRLVPTLKSLPR